MNDFVKHAVHIAERYEMTDLKERLEAICPPENVPYLKVAIVSSLNRLPNFIIGSELLPDKLILANQEPLCVTFDGSDDGELKTLHAQSEQWSKIPIRFYVITWDKAFYEDAAPSELLEKMDVIVFGMNAAGAFRRSMVERITETQPWDAVIVIEELETVPEDETDEFIRVCLQRTKNINIRGEQLVFWHKREPEIAFMQISSKILARWGDNESSIQDLRVFREEKFEQSCEEWIIREMKAALQAKICEIRGEMVEQRKALQENRERKALCRQAEKEMDAWIQAFLQSLAADMESLTDEIQEKNSQCLMPIPLTQKKIDAAAKETENQWKIFIESQYREMEISLLSKMQELRGQYSAAEKLTSKEFDRMPTAAVVASPTSFWYSPVLLAGIGVASYFWTGLGITLILAIPFLKVKQMLDKNGIMKSLSEANARIAAEIINAFRSDLLICKENVMDAFEMENLTDSDGSLEHIRQRMDTLQELCDLFDEYNK